MKSLGLDIGSTSVKATLLSEKKELWHEVILHEGNIANTIKDILAKREVDSSNIVTLCTGGSGRYHLKTEQIILPQAIEAALSLTNYLPNAVISLGGETLIIYTTNQNGYITNAFMGDKCAAGSGEFMRQQLARMNMNLTDIALIADDTRPSQIASRCSVFMKSDCTHKLNKHEATKEEITVSLAQVMANKIGDFLSKAQLASGKILLIGGGTANKFLLKFLYESFPEIDFIVPKEAQYFEALGAANLAIKFGRPLPALPSLFEAQTLAYKKGLSLASYSHLVNIIEAKRSVFIPEKEYVLGIDGGSTTTKAVLVDLETSEIVASYYGRTHGDPVSALRLVLSEIKKQIDPYLDNKPIKISLAATTGSGREVLGVFVNTEGIYNEIIAHAIGATYFKKDIDTIFEIGGQDAKYVFLKNGVPIDYAMNEACSAGTGSFLEESARGDLNIQSASEIGEIALTSKNPLKFGEHCSAFINSDVRKAIQQGALKEDIVAGIVLSIVSNYLNRVVGNRNIGGNIVLQGGVAKNHAVPLAFAAILNTKITVPPDPELLGAFGVAILAIKKNQENLLQKSEFFLTELIERKIEYGKSFNCNSCKNSCPIKIIKVGSEKHCFGGRCAKFSLSRKKNLNNAEKQNLVELRDSLIFKDFAPDPFSLKAKSLKLVGILKAFTVHSLYPFYAWFFHDLGVRTYLSQNSHREGVRKIGSAFCFPAEIAHGMTEDLCQNKVDYFFFPHVKNLESFETDVHATVCPITQGMPYYLRPAFGIPDEKILRPVIDFKGGEKKAALAFIEIAEKLGFSKACGLRAFNTAWSEQKACFKKMRTLGQEILKQASVNGEILIALLGRPYNAFNGDANMGIPKKFASRGYRVIPYDFFPINNEQISDNMYWYYGQFNLKVAKLVKDNPNIFVCYVSNFGCAPDSFLLHFLRWSQGTKPFLVIELDSHTADAGLDTRIEAFLDIITGYKTKLKEINDIPKKLRYSMAFKQGLTTILDNKSDTHIPLNSPHITLLIPSMGRRASEAIASVSNFYKINAISMPPADAQTTQLARNVASGKECIPTLLVLGQALKLLKTRETKPNEILVIVAAKTTGPCRTGQYGPFYEQTFADLGIENIAVLQLNSDNSYKELGKGFTRIAWEGINISDCFRDMETTLKVIAKNPESALNELEQNWIKIRSCLANGLKGIDSELYLCAKNLAKIEKKKSLAQTPKVLVVGEIFVRRDDFSISELMSNMTQSGIIAKVTGIGEWINYCDYIREAWETKEIKNSGFFKRDLLKHLKNYLQVKIQRLGAHYIEHKVNKILKTTELLPAYPNDINAIMATVEEMSSLDFETEATISSLVAAAAIKQGYDGIVVIAPFGCLPGHVMQAILEKFCNEKKVPFMSLENDGNPYSPSTITRLEIFSLNVLRLSSERKSKLVII